jgi:putative ABC transport system permease protein
MSWMDTLFRPKRMDRQLADELEFHIEGRTRDLVKTGVPEAEARRRAGIEFGGMESVKDDCRDVRRGQFIEELFKDLHYALRVFRKTPAFSLAAIGTLALGIGACTAIFTVVDDVLLRPLSYPEPDRLVRPLTKNPPLGIKNGPASYADYLDWRDSGVFESVGIYLTDNVVLSVGGQSERVVCVMATSGVLSALRVKPLAGRIFTPEESTPSLTPVVLLTERTWRRRFGANPKLLGSAIKLNGLSLTVAGILPASFTFEGDPEVWTSPIHTGDEATRENRYWSVLARLRTGVTLRRTGVQLDQISRRLAAAYPASNRDWGVDIVSLKEDIVGDTRAQLLVLLGAVGFVWLIVCANIATLLLVRASGRSREMAVRAALGASGARLVRQLATESLVLVLAGGAAGIGMALAAVSLLREYGPADLPRLDQIHVDAISVAFTLGIAIITGLLCSLGPVFQTRGHHPSAGLQEGGRSATGSRRRSLTRAALVMTEVGLSIVLLTGSGLLIKSFWNLLREDTGFRTDHLLTFFLSLPNSKVMENGQYRREKVVRYVDSVTARLESIPGVQHVGLGMSSPLGGGGWQVWSKFWVAGEGSSRAGFLQGISQSVTPDYFAALGVPLRWGRAFSDHDGAHTPAVAIVNEEFARQKFAHRNPIGRRIGIEDGKETFEIVGVVGSLKSGGLQEPSPPQIYLPMGQQPVPMLSAVLRTTGDPAALGRTAQQAILGVDPDVPAYRLRTGDQLLGRSLARRRLLVTLISSFAAIALVLALLGLYGVLAYGVAQRTREIGIRMALGAAAGQVLAGVVRQGMIIASLGAVAGLAGALAITRVLKDALYNVSPLDAGVLLVAPLALLVVALLACAIPARRAARIDPVLALRHE